jgi:hypothetical protein
MMALLNSLNVLMNVLKPRLSYLVKTEPSKGIRTMKKVVEL